MQKNLDLSSRNYLDNTFQPVAETLTSPTDLLISPAANTTVSFYDQVNLSWQAVTGATYFLLEVDVTPTFSAGTKQMILPAATTSITFNDLVKGKNYWWRVRPFNEYFTCDLGKSAKFTTSQTSSTGIPEIEAINEWKLVPNPVSSRAALQISVDASQNFEANVRIANSIGQQVYSKSGVNFAAGENLISIENTSLAPGIYQVFLASGDALMSKKLVVAR